MNRATLYALTAAATIAACSAQPVTTKAFSPAVVAPGGVTNIRFTISNPGPATLTGVSFTDILQAGLTVANGGSSNNCTAGSSGALTAGNNSITANATIAAGGSCTFT